MPAPTVVITGASSGFGRGVALRLAQQGCNLVLAARRGHLLEQLAAECGRNAIAVHCDVGDPNDVEKLAAAAIAKFNRIDVWINNAGVAALGAFERIPLEDHLRVMQTNLGGAIAGSHVALRHFRQVGAGTLVNVAHNRLPNRTDDEFAGSTFAMDALFVNVQASSGMSFAIWGPWHELGF